MLFSTFACFLLQEAAARLTIVSGKNLGQAIVSQFEKSKSQLLVLLLVLGAIVLGAAAYEMGNLLRALLLNANYPTRSAEENLVDLNAALAANKKWCGSFAWFNKKSWNA